MSKPEPTPKTVAMSIRASLEAAGIPYTTEDLHAALHEAAPGIAVRQAETIHLLFSHRDDPGQAGFNRIMTAALDAIALFIRLCFAEFGPADEEAVNATIQRAIDALIDRLKVLGASIVGEGFA